MHRRQRRARRPHDTSGTLRDSDVQTPQEVQIQEEQNTKALKAPESAAGTVAPRRPRRACGHRRHPRHRAAPREAVGGEGQKDYATADKIAMQLQQRNVAYHDESREWYVKALKSAFAASPVVGTKRRLDDDDDAAVAADDDDASSSDDDDSEEDRLDDAFVLKMQKRLAAEPRRGGAEEAEEEEERPRRLVRPTRRSRRKHGKRPRGHGRPPRRTRPAEGKRQQEQHVCSSYVGRSRPARASRRPRRRARAAWWKPRAVIYESTARAGGACVGKAA